jgi:hypothetical protein
LWTFLFFCEPFFGSKESKYVSDIPENSLSDVKEWISECVHSGSSHDHLENLEKDGFGVIVKILRDIKSSWKLMLNEFENFLEEIVRKVLLHSSLDDRLILPRMRTSRTKNLSMPPLTCTGNSFLTSTTYNDSYFTTSAMLPT